MGKTITMDRAGRLVLPKAIRERLNLEGGAELVVQTVGDHVELRPLEIGKPVEIKKRKGRLVIQGEGEVFDAKDVVAGAREDRELHLKK